VKIETWFVRFEGNPNHDANGKFRVVSGSKLKPVAHSDEIVEFVKVSDISLLIEILGRYLKNDPREKEHDHHVLNMHYLAFRDVIIRSKL
jgi:hypothetical protein